jgi:thiosulfate dehydrogenase [quinone] large subunit
MHQPTAATAAQAKTPAMRLEGGAWYLAGLLATPLRWVMGWIYFSAFWRRVVLAPAKLDPDSGAYLGHKFNHFMPGSLMIGDMIEYLLGHETLLFVFLLVFTIIEGLVGLGLLLGLFSRLSGLGTALLAFGILLGAGWLGTTCLDEWQIGATGIGAGLAILLTGSGPLSLDYGLGRRYPGLARRPAWAWLASGPLPLARKGLLRLLGILAGAGLLITLWTNQVLHDGLWGQLHNPSKRPHIQIQQAGLNTAGKLQLQLYRDQGPDTYGAYLVQLRLKNAAGETVARYGPDSFRQLAATQIKNEYLNKVRVAEGGHSLIVPLGGQAQFSLRPAEQVTLAPGAYTLELIDASGMRWTTTLQLD